MDSLIFTWSNDGQPIIHNHHLAVHIHYLCHLLQRALYTWHTKWNTLTAYSLSVEFIMCTQTIEGDILGYVCFRNCIEIGTMIRIPAYYYENSGTSPADLHQRWVDQTKSHLLSVLWHSWGTPHSAADQIRPTFLETLVSRVWQQSPERAFSPCELGLSSLPELPSLGFQLSLQLHQYIAIDRLL